MTADNGSGPEGEPMIQIAAPQPNKDPNVHLGLVPTRVRMEAGQVTYAVGHHIGLDSGWPSHGSHVATNERLKRERSYDHLDGLELRVRRPPR